MNTLGVELDLAFLKVLCGSLVIVCLSGCDLATAQSSVCFTFDSGQDSYETCDSSTTWAVDIPSLSVTHNFSDSEARPHLVTYSETPVGSSSSTLCSYSVQTGTTCTAFGSSCLTCINDIDSTGQLVASFSLANLVSSKDQMVVSYEIDRDPGLKQLFVLNLAGCDLNMFTGALSSSSDTCGYNCTREFNCVGDYEGGSFSRRCLPNAQWDVPTTDCELRGLSPGQIAGIVETALGFVLLVISASFVAVIVVREMQNGYETLLWVTVGLLITGFILWMIGVILCFVTGADASSGLTEGQTAGVVLGALGIACLASSAGISIYIYKQAANGSPPDQRDNIKQKREAPATDHLSLEDKTVHHGGHVGPQKDLTHTEEGPNKKGQGSHNPKTEGRKCQDSKKGQESRDLKSQVDKSAEKGKTPTHEF